MRGFFARFLPSINNFPGANKQDCPPTPARRFSKLLSEVLVGLFFLAAVGIGALYYSLEKGAIDLNFVVPSIEKAINQELTGLSVKIDSAFVGKNLHSGGVHFRLRKIVLYNKLGDAIATAPLAAVDLNATALMWGRIAPSQVIFIQPTLNIAYNADNGLSLSYARSKGAEDVIADLLDKIVSPKTADTGVLQAIGNIEIMNAVTAAFEEARSHRNTSSYLTQFGVQDATVNFSHGSKRYSWNMPDFIMDLKHNDKGSIIRGFGKLGIGDADQNIAPWKLRFQTQQFDKSKDLQLDFGFKDITPASLIQILPDLLQLRNFALPFEGKVNARLNADGELKGAFVNILLSKGKIKTPWLNMEEDGIDGLEFNSGELKMAYSSKNKKLHILPSPLKWGDNETIISGALQLEKSNGPSKRWRFALRGSDTRLTASEFGLKPMIIDEWWLTGVIVPDQNSLEIAGFFLRAGNALINIKGHITNLQSSPGLYLEGKVSGISVPVLKRLWPRVLAVGARNWVGENIMEGQVVGGTFKIAIPPGVIDKLPNDSDITPEMVQAEFKLGDLLVSYIPDAAPLKIADAEIKITGRQLSIELPKGRIKLPGNNQLRISHGSFTIADLRKEYPDSDLNFRLAGRARDLISFVRQPAVEVGQPPGDLSNRINGDLKGVVSMHIPLKKNVTFSDISLNGDLRLENMNSKKLYGDLFVEAGTINIKLTEKAIGAKGGVVIKGIPVKLNWQYIFGKKSRQPPMRLSAVLGKRSRTKIGLSKANDYVKGDIAVVATIIAGDSKAKMVQVRADLTNARISNTPIGWSKPPGMAAVLQFDIAQNKGRYIDLKNFNLVGQELALEGTLRLNRRTGSMNSFSFPNVSYKKIHNMALVGKIKDNGVLRVSARIKELEGIKLLRDKFFKTTKKARKSFRVRKSQDFDLEAKIELITGSKGAFISHSQLDIKKRNGKLTQLNFKGKLNGQAFVGIRLDKDASGKRVLKAESADAGSTFRMIGLYPNVQGGKLSLIVDMDAKGRKGKTGTLWVKNFDVITSKKIKTQMNSREVFSNDLITKNKPRRSRNRTRMMQTRMKFSQLKAPFSFGNGQFILHDSYVNGPVIGATLRGRIDFRSEWMTLGGTYVPLYDVNSAIGEIPVLSSLLVGRKGEGVFGVTFAIEGPTSKPTVIVNPVSILAPGVFRQIFDFNNTVKTRGFQNKPRKRRKKRRRNINRNEAFQ
ncbi:MAG: DUF3971 domain-containing protein [Hyphomicrobiaceae bacterium]|nr:DUF3971 domain-containing protein [Hyphomicrobiaceae bacterium]